MKYYFADKSDTICYPLQYHKNLLEFEGWDELELFEAEPNKVDGFFWCHYYDSVGDKSESPCGKLCEGYAPKNGKCGCCKYYSLIFYEATDKTKIITKWNN